MHAPDPAAAAPERGELPLVAWDRTRTQHAEEIVQAVEYPPVDDAHHGDLAPSLLAMSGSVMRTIAAHAVARRVEQRRAHYPATRLDDLAEIRLMQACSPPQQRLVRRREPLPL